MALPALTKAGDGTGMNLSRYLSWSPQDGVSTVSITFKEFSGPKGVTEILSGSPLTKVVIEGHVFTECKRIYFGSNGLTECPALPPFLTYLNLEGNSVSSLPALPATLQTLVVAGNPVTALPSLPVPLIEVYAQECALSQAAVDAILAQLVANGQSNGSCVLSDGTNAAPSAAGAADAATLVSRGWTVTVNS